MLAVRHSATLAVATTLISLAVLVRPAAAQVEGGTHIPIRLETPRDYKGAGETPETRWSYELHDSDATYIAIHFRDFDLGPGDYLLVSDGAGRQAYTLQGRGKMNAGTFWAQHIKGDTVLLDLVVVGYEGGHGFEIDEYVAGFIDLGPPPTSRAICGTDDKQNAKCYQLSHPTEYNRGRAVCRLLSNGSAFCTGWLASAENHVITNEHCITSASEALNTDFDFMAEAPTCGTPNCANCFPGVVYSGATFIQDSYNYDYCLVQIASGNPAASFGYLELDNRVAVPGEEIYIPQHPGGRAKEFAIFSTAPQDAGGIARVYSIAQPACQGSGYSDVGYYADTEGGSSGSPVIARSSHKVIALHHCANCPNRGVPITLVYGEIGAYLTPGPAGTLELDKGRYGCADLVAVELRDGDLLGTGTHAVTVAATGGDAETITLTETGANTGVFVGTIATSAGPVNSGDGTLQVADSQTMTATYIDADDGAGNYNVPVTDSAAVDCVGPQILNVQTTSVEPRSATVTITANEAVRGMVRYGLSCNELGWTATGSGFATAAVVNVTGLTDDTTYYYKVEAADEA
ncbi:MAG TPA: trypsin-like peptidase domain-containing protein, partial [Phycisphaerae bacterium]|nr:trypsin-like peptidase domain-containing protein [Phycisphaerae bacterium]